MSSTEPIADDDALRHSRADTRTPSAASSASTTPKDEFGLDPYTPTYGTDTCAGAVPQHFLKGGTLGSHRRLESVVPWEIRSVLDHPSCTSLRFVATRHFWECVENAVRVALVAMLPAAIMLHATFDDGNGPWVSQSFIISGALLASVRKETIGLQFAYMGQFFRASVLWVAIVTAETALHIYEYTAGWFIVYGVSVFCMATFMDGYARRLGMLLLTVATMNMLRFQVTDEVRPLRICLEWLVGAGFGFMASLVPWPAFSSRKADKAMHVLAKNISTSLQGLAASFWTDTNLTRNVRMVRVRFLLTSVEKSIGKVKEHLEGAAYEWPFESARRRRLRTLKVSLYVDMYRNLNSIRRVIEIVRDRPAILENSERAVLFGQRLEKKMGGICTTVDELLYHISSVQSRRALVETPLFDALAAIESDMQHEFHDARRAYFYESTIEHLEEFVPLMTFYVFSMSQICGTLMRMRETVRRDLRQDATDSVAWRMYARDAVEYLMFPLVGTVETAKGVFMRRSPEDKRRVVEAAKLSSAMVASLAFYFYTDETTAFLSGPTVIAFIASSNPSEALVSAAPRLTGTLMGVVIGFFIGSTAETSVARIAGLITLAFVARLVAHVKTIGPALSYSTFIAISQVSVVPLSKDATMSRIQQSTFAVFIYVIITIFVFPVRPTALLRHARAEAVLSMADVYRSIMEVLAETGDVYDALMKATKTPSPGNSVAKLLPEAARNTAGDSVEIAFDRTVTFAGGSFAANFLEFPKDKFEAIDRQLKAIDRLLLTAQGLMPFAADEPRMTLVPYPSRACDDAQTALKKSVALLRTMSQSVRLLRERLVLPSPEMIALFRNLVPCTRDSVVELRRFSMLVASLIEERRLDLGSELAKSSQQFSHMCALLHRRKSHVFLVCIKKAVTAARQQHHPHQADAFKERGPDSNNERQPPHHDGRHRHQRTPTMQLPMVDSPTCAHRDDRFGQMVSMDDITAATYAMAQLDETVRRPSRHPSPTSTRPRGGAPFPQPREDVPGTSGGGGHNRQSGGGGAKGVLEQRVPLPESFQIPISTQDAEGVHALTFSVVLLSAELRKLVVAVEDTLQHHSQ